MKPNISKSAWSFILISLIVSSNLVTAIIPHSKDVNSLRSLLEKPNKGSSNGAKILGKAFTAGDLKALRQSAPSSESWPMMADMGEVAECFVDVVVTERVPGKCSMLANRIPVCQAKDQVAANYNECSVE